MFHRILVAYDGSDSARHAFEKAIELAKEFRSEVFALAVVQLPEPPLVAEAGVMLEDATAHLQKDFDAFTATAQAADLRFGSRAVLGHGLGLGHAGGVSLEPPESLPARHPAG